MILNKKFNKLHSSNSFRTDEKIHNDGKACNHTTSNEASVADETIQTSDGIVLKVFVLFLFNCILSFNCVSFQL